MVVGRRFLFAIFVFIMSFAQVVYGETSLSLENEFEVELTRRSLLNVDPHDSVVALANGAGASMTLNSGFTCNGYTIPVLIPT